MSFGRDDFPVLERGVYANTASSGLLSGPLHHWRRERDSKWLTGEEGALADIPAELERIRSTVANFVGTSSPRISLLPNFSWGMNAVASSLGRNHARVVVLEGDYPSLVWPVEDHSPGLIRIPWGIDIEDRIYTAIRDHAVEALVVSMVQWTDGRKLPLGFYRRLKEEFPSLLIAADGSQFLGTEPFRFDDSGIDVLGTSGYKWLLGGYGNGFFAFSDYAMQRLDIRVIGNNSTLAKSGEREEIAFHRSLEPGHLDLLNFGSLAFSMDYLTELGLDRVCAQLGTLAEATWEIMDEVDPAKVRVVDRACHGSIYWFPCGRQAFDHLIENGVRCSWRNDGIRISWHFYNSLEDVAGFLAALTRC